MPTNRKRVTRRRRGASIKPEYWALLNDQPLPPPATVCQSQRNRWCRFFFYANGEGLRLWQAYRGVVLAAWITRRPGTRPSCWWLYERDLQTEPRRVSDTHIESEAAYLKRLGLLTKEEAKRLTAADFEPQPRFKPREGAQSNGSQD